MLQITWTDHSGNVFDSYMVKSYTEPLPSDNRRFITRSVLKFVPKMDYHNKSIWCQAYNSAVDKKLQTKIRMNVNFAPKVSRTTYSLITINTKRQVITSISRALNNVNFNSVPGRPLIFRLLKVLKLKKKKKKIPYSQSAVKTTGVYESQRFLSRSSLVTFLNVFKKARPGQRCCYFFKAWSGPVDFLIKSVHGLAKTHVSS